VKTQLCVPMLAAAATMWGIFSSSERTKTDSAGSGANRHSEPPAHSGGCEFGLGGKSASHAGSFRLLSAIYGASPEPMLKNNSRIAAGVLNNPIIYDRYANGFTVSQLVTDFGRTHESSRVQIACTANKRVL